MATDVRGHLSEEARTHGGRSEREEEKERTKVEERGVGRRLLTTSSYAAGC